MGKFLWALILLLGVVFIFGKLADLQAVAETMQREDWRFLVLALGVEALWLFNVAVSYWAIYRAVGIEERLSHLIPLAAAANFTNIVAPTGGMSGTVVFVSAARQRNYSPARAAVAGALYVVFDYFAFLSVLALGLIVLIRRNSLHPAHLVASGTLFVLALGMAFLMYLGVRSADRLGLVLARMARLVNRLLRILIHRDYLSEQRAHAFAHDAAAGLRDLVKTPENILYPAALALSSKVLLVAILALTLLAFRLPFTIGTLVAGFSIAYLFVIVSPTPMGIGFVEGALALALSPVYGLSRGALIAVVYRGITFWAPLFAGMVAFRWLRTTRKIETG